MRRKTPLLNTKDFTNGGMSLLLFFIIAIVVILFAFPLVAIYFIYQYFFVMLGVYETRAKHILVFFGIIVFLFFAMHYFTKTMAYERYINSPSSRNYQAGKFSIHHSNSTGDFAPFEYKPTYLSFIKEELLYKFIEKPNTKTADELRQEFDKQCKIQYNAALKQCNRLKNEGRKSCYNNIKPIERKCNL